MKVQGLELGHDRVLYQSHQHVLTDARVANVEVFCRVEILTAQNRGQYATLLSA